MGVLQERILMIDDIAVTSWDMQLIQDLLYTGIQTRLLLSTEPIMFGLTNIIIISSYKTNILHVLYYFKNILKVLFIIETSSTGLNVNLILHPLHSLTKQLSNMKLGYLLLERKLVLIYWMMRILQYLLSLI